MSDQPGAQMQQQSAQWKTLKQQAESGQLQMDPEIGRELAAHAERMAKALDVLTSQARWLSYLGGFGTLSSANALQGKFSSKALGGDDAAVTRLGQSIEVLTLMKETYELAAKTLSETDQANAQQLSQQGQEW
ncbi:hypothetical protein APR12_006185 [Nocardia amikacinitolerans]|uniref:hypothetical protein n=1 Tax=Nocardia amikacinitolerans TaxID=756689 RepID=UPI0009FF2920|nr:hypothetical protein [Nocardia amikacinitolerans]MCP2320798.1 hypothetical protein [Nocardia amikacinitolerans]